MAIVTMAGPARNTVQLQQGDFVAICGDSITEERIYSVYIQDYLLMCQPVGSLRTLQAGWDGEQAPHFLERMEYGVLPLGPNVATTCYGMNDSGYSPMTDEKGQRYRDAQRAIVRKLKEKGVRTIVLGSAGCVDSDTYMNDPAQAEICNKTLGQMRDIAREVAEQENVIFADVYSPMMDVMRKSKAMYGRSYHLAGVHGVHPGRNGHLVMAYAFLKALGCDGNIGIIKVDMNSGKTDATAGHKILSAADGVIEVESSRYPFCFYGDPTSPKSTSGVIEFIPFNEELNRFMLVVKNIREDADCKVTWGDTTRNYTGGELARGINLAADFLDNPFSDKFKKNEEIFLEQQIFETRLTRFLLHRLPDFLMWAPETKADVERLIKTLCKKDEDMAAASSAKVTPVRHSIKIEVNTAKAFVWESQIPADCPFERSKSLAGIEFTGRHGEYVCGDTWYPSWASDGNLYSPWTDGRTEGMGCSSAGSDDARTAHAVMIGDNPLNLKIRNTSQVKVAAAAPYVGRYPAGSLVYNGIWYYATYCLGPTGGYNHRGFVWNWPILGPMPGFQISYDLGKTWTPSPLSPAEPLFPEPSKHLGPVKMGAPHFVDFGRNMEHSPDGKAYMLGMGAVEGDPMPRPCLKVGKPGEPFGTQPCTEDFAHANLSWISADQIYLARVTPSPETINDIKAWEFFAGHDRNAKPIWTSDFKNIKPLIEWNNNMGCVTATYVPALKKYLMCVTDGWPTVAKMDSYILEADTLTGPWRIVTYMKDFGEQGYFLNFPSKFISSDGLRLWLCYSANFSSGWNGMELKFNPPGGRYGLSLHEVRLLTAEKR